MLQSAPVAGFLLLFCQCTFRMLQLPFMWKQFQQFLMSSLFVIGHSGDDIIQIIPWGYIMCLQVASREQITDILAAASWLPQKR